jgi:hypothetical protein
MLRHKAAAAWAAGQGKEKGGKEEECKEGGMISAIGANPLSHKLPKPQKILE